VTAEVVKFGQFQSNIIATMLHWHRYAKRLQVPPTPNNAVIAYTIIRHIRHYKKDNATAPQIQPKSQGTNIPLCHVSKRTERRVRPDTLCLLANITA